MLKINFRRINIEKDMEKLYKAYGEYEERSFFSNPYPINSLSEFRRCMEANLAKSYHDFFIVENSEEEYIGFCATQDYNANDGVINIMVYICPEHRVSSYGALIVIKLMRMNFNNYSIRKVYSDVFGYNVESINAHEKFGFKKVAVLEEYHYFRNKYWPLITYCMDKAEFDGKWGLDDGKLFI